MQQKWKLDAVTLKKIAKGMAYAMAPASYTFGTTGEKTLYGWCKDSANNVSTSGSDTVTVSQAISKAPFIIP